MYHIAKFTLKTYICILVKSNALLMKSFFQNLPFLLALIIISLTGCLTTKVNVIEYTTYAELGLNDRIDTFKNHVKIVTFKEYKAYIMPVDHIEETKTGYTSTPGNLYAVFQRGKASGHIYDLTKSSSGNLIELDAALKQNNLGKMNMGTFSQDFGNAEEISNIGRNKVLYKYAVVNSSKNIDSIYRFFDGDLNDIPFSLSPSLDQITSKKLYKMTIIGAPREVVKNGKLLRSPKSLQIFEWHKSHLTRKEETDLHSIIKTLRH